MLSTKNIIKQNIKEIPEEVIYETYLDIPELTGQDVKIKSLFNPQDSKPSMFIYVANGKYRWKDFSSGKQGNAVQLVREILKCSYEEACEDIRNKIKDVSFTPRKIKENNSRYKVIDLNIRDYNEDDMKYWEMFSITREELLDMGVYPLEKYVLANNEKEIIIEKKYVYGFFNKDGLYKIYQPKIKDMKFLKIKPYIQGTEQLKGKEKLIITKSIKDMICLRKIQPDADYIAVDSENSYLETNYVSKLKKSYKDIVVIFDNDRAGIESMKYYKRTFGFKFILFPFAKDIADSVRYLGLKATKHYLTKKL